MLKKIFKWAGIVIGVLLILGFSCYGIISHNISSRMDKRYEYLVPPVAIPSDSASLQRGAHLLAIKGCYDCHGNNMAGKVMIDDGMMGRIIASNLTKGAGGLPADYSDDDWVRALRHGIDRRGRPLVFMPSHETALLSENDMAAIIAFCEKLPPVDNRLPEMEIGPVARIMAYLDKFPLLSVEKIDHFKEMMRTADTTEGIQQGQYLAVSCTGCHRDNMKGGEPLAPGLPPVPDITAAGQPGKWTQAQFIGTLRTGKTPSGHEMKNDDMPWKMTAQYSEKELASLYQYLQSLK